MQLTFRVSQGGVGIVCYISQKTNPPTPPKSPILVEMCHITVLKQKFNLVYFKTAIKGNSVAPNHLSSMLTNYQTIKKKIQKKHVLEENYVKYCYAPKENNISSQTGQQHNAQIQNLFENIN